MTFQYDTIRYYTRCYLTCNQKLTRVTLIHRTEPTTKSGKTENNWKVINRHAQKYRLTVWGIRGVSPEEENEGYGGKDLQKRKVLSLEWSRSTVSAANGAMNIPGIHSSRSVAPFIFTDILNICICVWLYYLEAPTILNCVVAWNVRCRSQAMGIVSFLGRIGSMIAPFTATVVSLQSVNRSINHSIRYDRIRDAILTCARKPTWVSLIYRTEPATKKCKTEKLKSKNGYAQT